MKIEVTEYKIRNGPIRWQINIISIILDHFFLALTIFEILHIIIFRTKCVTLKACQGQDVQHFIGAIRLPVSPSIKVAHDHFSLALTVLPFAYFKFFQKFVDLENIGS